MTRDLGRFGEELIIRAFPRWKLRRQPGSGNRWPRQEDLEGPRHLVQVKTTRSTQFLGDFLTLTARARTEDKESRWMEVHISATGREAVIFERKYVATVELGVGGE